MNDLTLRALGVGATVVSYAALCASIFIREKRRHLHVKRAASALAGDGVQTPTLVLFASQTGQAESIAWQTARWLHAAGTPAHVLALDEVDVDVLVHAPRALFIVSTYGEGDAPDGASLFAEKLMASTVSLPRLRYAVLALGSRQYAHFCGFGRALDRWLRSCGATPMAGRIDVDNSDPTALAEWQTLWGGNLGNLDEPTSDVAPWQLRSRTLLNPGSAGGPVYELDFVEASANRTSWQSGDLAQLVVSSDPGRPRDYSIASIPADGHLSLIVRQEQHADGSLGAASGLLTSTLAVGESVALRLRPHPRFRLDGNGKRPLILIGNGTGLAGLRGHLRARAVAGQAANWLVFGERNAAHDFLCRDEIERWQRDGALERVDLVFSRDQPDRRYVQHRLLASADDVRAWMDRGAAVYVCGSLQGMAAGVDSALKEIVGVAKLDALSRCGRYKRDVY